MRTGWFVGAVRAALRALWFVLIPLFFCGLVVRFLVPHSSSVDGFEGEFARTFREHALWFTLALFVTFVALARYWRARLPGGRYLSHLPADLVERVPPRRTAECENALGLLAWLKGASASRWTARLAPESLRALSAARDGLLTQLATGKWSLVEGARARLALLCEPARGRAEAFKLASFAALLGVATVLALTARSRLLQTYEVSGTSMLPTLAPGDVLAGSRSAYTRGRLPRRGDVIILRATVLGQEHELIKRVLGLPGDRITMRGVHPVINGWPVPVCDVGAYYSPTDETAKSGDPGGRLGMEFLEAEAYLVFQAPGAPPLTDYVVKADELFVAGDNRNNSRDSRNFAAGEPTGFALRDVRARATRILFSHTSRGELDPHSVLTPLGRALHLDGLELGAVRAGIERCLSARPAATTPPASGAAAFPVSRAP